eukprot:m.65224 g.65224  ORF g.65224 m.65224 type:complete len:132 (-) comp13532_c3_seq1:59-454(-)
MLVLFTTAFYHLCLDVCCRRFVGDLSKDNANSLLKESPPGTFLVRTTESQCILSIKGPHRANHSEDIRHFEIHRTDDGQVYMNQDERFRSIPAMMEDYIMNMDEFSQNIWGNPTIPLVPYAGSLRRLASES